MSRIEETFDDGGILLDLRFLEIGTEMWALEEYFHSVKEELPSLTQKARDRILEHVEPKDDIDVRTSISDFTEDYLPRFFWSPILIALWAVYESGVIEIAKSLQSERGYLESIEDALKKRGGALNNLKRYYLTVLDLPLMKVEDTERFEMLIVLRHALAHGNGREAAVQKRHWEKIVEWEHQHKGISTDSGYLTISEGFIEEMLTIIGDSLDNLIERVKSMK